MEKKYAIKKITLAINQIKSIDPYNFEIRIITTDDRYFFSVRQINFDHANGVITFIMDDPLA